MIKKNFNLSLNLKRTSEQWWRWSGSIRNGYSLFYFRKILDNNLKGFQFVSLFLECDTKYLFLFYNSKPNTRQLELVSTIASLHTAMKISSRLSNGSQSRGPLY